MKASDALGVGTQKNELIEITSSRTNFIRSAIGERLFTFINYLSVCFLWLSLALLTGCSSLNKPASGGFASVLIKNSSEADIRNTTIKVFKKAEYYTYYYSQDQNALIFEKEGSQAQSLAYNGIAGTQSGSGILNRVKAKIVDRGDGSYWLSCQAFVVRNANDKFAAEEIRLTSLHSGPYQKLLDEVAARLKNGPTSEPL
jgi:hypothetical protein